MIGDLRVLAGDWEMVGLKSSGIRRWYVFFRYPCCEHTSTSIDSRLLFGF